MIALGTAGPSSALSGTFSHPASLSLRRTGEGKTFKDYRLRPFGALTLHFHEAGFGGEVGVAGAFEFTAFLDCLGAKDFAEQVVAGFPFAGAFALAVVLEREGAIGVVGHKAIAVAAGILKSLAHDCRLNFGGGELADGLRLSL